MSKSITFRPIGTIHSPFTELADMPIQPVSDSSAAGTVELFPQYIDGLKDLDGFSHIYLIYHLHEAGKPRLMVTPFLDDEPRGLFATRAPNRPNPIGLSLVKLSRIEGNILYIEDLDILDGTPLLDLKPYVPGFEDTADVQGSWVEKAQTQLRSRRSDTRFSRRSLVHPDLPGFIECLYRL